LWNGVWRSRPLPNELVFPASDGRHWRDDTYRNWRRRTFKPAAKAAGLGNIRVYDLRHALASLLFAEGRNPAEIADQLDNTLETLLSTYVHVIENLRGQPAQKAEDVIRKARRKARHINVIQNSPELEPVEEKTP